MAAVLLLIELVRVLILTMAGLRDRRDEHGWHSNDTVTWESSAGLRRAHSWALACLPTRMPAILPYRTHGSHTLYYTVLPPRRRDLECPPTRRDDRLWVTHHIAAPAPLVCYQ